MTQRAEPALAPRKGKKPIKPEIIPPPPGKKDNEPPAERESGKKVATSHKKPIPVAKPTTPQKIENPAKQTTDIIEKPAKATRTEKTEKPAKSKQTGKTDKPAKTAKPKPLERAVSESSASSAGSSSSSSSGSSSGSSLSSSGGREAKANEKTESPPEKQDVAPPAKAEVPEKTVEAPVEDPVKKEERPPEKRDSASKAMKATSSHASAPPRNVATTTKTLKAASSHASKPKPTTPDAATAPTPDENATDVTPLEEKKSESVPVDDSEKNTDHDTKKKSKLGDMLSDLPSSSHCKKHQKHQKPNSSSASVPAIPTQDYIPQRTEAATEEFHQQPRRPSAGAAPAPSIRDRMNQFKGTGGVIKTVFPTNKGRLSGGRITSPVATKGTVPQEGRLPGVMADIPHNHASMGIIPSTSPHVTKPKLTTSTSVPVAGNKFQEPIARKQNAYNCSRVDADGADHGNNGSGEFMIDSSERSAGGTSVRSSLKNRMSVFEQNIKKNNTQGTVKKSLW
jgi:hypothetical protein